VHDTIAERFPLLTLPSARARLRWRIKVGLAIRQARLVLTVSEYSARSLTQVLGIPRSRIRVALEAPAAAYVPSEPADIGPAAARVGVPAGAPWFLYVGGFNPHKRIDTIVRCHARVARDAAVPPHLLLVGAASGDVFHGEAERLRMLIGEAGTEPLVHWTGFVPDEEVRHLASGAVALLMPSECEGFGLPAVEAGACGTPVIATVESPLPELLAGGGIFVRPGDEKAIEGAMRELLYDERRRRDLGRQARERASALSWQDGARSALSALHEAAT
jgi:glycosyltransferase involved in cell wall biosynthesis